MPLPWIKKAYLYLVSLISIVIIVIGAIMLLNIALKAYIFTKADDVRYTYCTTMVNTVDGKPVEQPLECTDKQYANDKRSAQRQSDAAQALAMILVAAPVFYYHWKLARKE